MSDCIFCKIVAQELPCHQVYEDNLFLGFLDSKPLNPGHTLLIPKVHYRWVYDVPQFGKYWEIAKKIGQAGQITTNSDFISFQTVGNEVPHAHIHIIPRFYNDNHHGVLIPENRLNMSQDELLNIAQNLKNNL